MNELMNDPPTCIALSVAGSRLACRPPPPRPSPRPPTAPSTRVTRLPPPPPPATIPRPSPHPRPPSPKSPTAARPSVKAPPLRGCSRRPRRTGGWGKPPQRTWTPPLGCAPQAHCPGGRRWRADRAPRPPRRRGAPIRCRRCPQRPGVGRGGRSPRSRHPGRRSSLAEAGPPAPAVAASTAPVVIPSGWSSWSEECT